MPSSKILGGGGKYKAKEGQPHIKRTEKPIPRGDKRIPGGGGAKAPPGPPPPEINPAGHLSSFQWPCESIHVVLST